MDITKAIKLTRTCVRSQLPVLLVGAPGVGKSDLVDQVSLFEGFDLQVSTPSVEDPTDPKGFPFADPSGEFARFLPYGHLARAVKATRPLLWFLDDLGQATPAVQAAYMQLLLARRVGEHAIPDWVTFVAATNRKADRAGVNGILEPVKSRFVTIIQVEPSLDAWVDWALTHSMPAELIAFLRCRPELLLQHKPTTEIVNSPNPRTWHNAGRLMNAKMDADCELEGIAGAVGMEAATEFVGFLKTWRDTVSPDSVLLNPGKAKIPKELSTLYMLTTALAHYANEQNFHQVVHYAERLADGGKAEMATRLVRDCQLRHPELTGTTAYITAATGPLGALFA